MIGADVNVKSPSFLQRFGARDQKESGISPMICRYMLRLISPTSNWHVRMEALFEEYPEIPVTDMGLAEGWKGHPVWTKDKLGKRSES